MAARGAVGSCWAYKAALEKGEAKGASQGAVDLGDKTQGPTSKC